MAPSQISVKKRYLVSWAGDARPSGQGEAALKTGGDMLLDE